MKNLIRISKSTGGRGSMSWYGISLMVFLAGFAFFFVVLPKTYDDYLFTWFTWPWFERQGLLTPEWGGDILHYGIPWDLIGDTWRNSYMYDNVRLPNLLAPIIMLFPRWVGGLIITFIFGRSVFLAFRLSGTDWRRSRLVPLATLLWMYFLPWYDHLTSLDFCLNYIFPTWLALEFITLLLKYRCSRSAGAVVAASILGVLVSWSHEEVGASVFGGLAGLLVFYKSWRKPTVYISTISVAMTVIAVISVPGMQMRSGIDLVVRNNIPDGLIQIWQGDAINYSLVLMMLVVSAMRLKIKRVFSNPLLAFFILSATLDVAAMFIIGYQGRAIYYAVFVSVIVLMMLIRLNFGGEKQNLRVLLTGTNLVLVLIIFYRLAVFDSYAVILRREALPALERFSADHENGLFVDIPFPDQQPIWMGRPVDPYVRETFIHFMTLVQGGLNIDPTAIRTPLPKVFEYVTFEKGTPVSGDTRIRAVNGLLYMTEEDADMLTARFSTGEVELDYGGGKGKEIVQMFRFRSKADGRYYVWLDAKYKGWFVNHFRPIIYARFVKNRHEKDIIL